MVLTTSTSRRATTTLPQVVVTTISLGSGNDTVDAGAGTDSVDSQSSVDLDGAISNAENVTASFTGSATIDATGIAGYSSLTVTAADDTATTAVNNIGSSTLAWLTIALRAAALVT